MKADFEKYLTDIGIGEIIKAKIEFIYGYYEKLAREMLKEEILDIFVGDYIQQDNTRVYEEVVFFSDNFMFTTSLFSKQDNLDIYKLKNLNIRHIGIEYQDYDFQTANEKSRLFFKIHLDSLTGMENRASRENCDKLYSIYSKYLIPRLI